MSNQMTRIEQWFSTHLPSFLADLAPGCSDAALIETESLIETELPEDFKNLYRWHDGQNSRFSSGFFYGWPFISLAEVRREWAGWKEVMQSGGWDNLDIFESVPPGAIKETYSSTGWIPFAIDGGGNHLGIDLDPGPAGARGQVINFGRDEERKFVLAPSLNDFFAWFADQLEEGNFLIREEPDAGIGSHVIRRRMAEDRGEEAEATPEPCRQILTTKNMPRFSFIEPLKVKLAEQYKR